jgi:hypothetical protein
MSSPTTTAPGRTGTRGRSIAAIGVAIVANVVLSLAADQLFHTLGAYPPWGQPMYEARDNLLALSYRMVFGILAGYLAARLAPSRPVRHVQVLGVIALVLASLGVVVTVVGPDLGPAWYPIALAITAYPCVWLGGRLYLRRATN